MNEMKKLEIVMEMVAHGYHLFNETPQQFADRFTLEQLQFFLDCWMGKEIFP